MPKVLFAGGERESVKVISGTVSEITTSGHYDSSYARCALRVVLGADIFETPFIDESNAATTVVSGQTAFLHFEWYSVEIETNAGNPVMLCNSSGQPWFGIRHPSINAYRLVYNSNTGASPTYTDLHSFTVNDNEKHTYDLKVGIDAGGGGTHSYEFFIDGSSVASGTFTNSNLTSLACGRFAGINGSDAIYDFSQIMAVEGRSTVGGKVRTRVNDGPGAGDTWPLGVRTDINETVLSDTSIKTADTAGQQFTYTYQDVTTPAGLVIASVFLNSRAKNDGASPTNLKAVARVGGTDYLTGNLAGMGVGFAPILAQFPTNPATSAAWDDTAFNGAEFGSQAAA